MLKKFILRIVIFFSLLIILDLINGAVLRKIYFKQNHGGTFRITYLLEKATPEIIILGSSKAVHHYISVQIQDSLKTTCYNGGRDGSFIHYSNAACNSILKRYSPKIIILDLLDDEFEQRSYKIEDRLSMLLPYYKTHPEIRSIVDMKSPFEKYKLLSGMYTFNSLLLPAITGVRNSKSKKIDENDLGYLPWYGKWEGDISQVDSREEKIDNNKIKALKNIITECNENNIKLIIVVSPTYKKYTQNYSPTVELASKIADSSKVPFWNYLQDTTYLNHKALFNDIRHLNNDGAKIFTADITKRLKLIY